MHVMVIQFYDYRKVQRIRKFGHAKADLLVF